MKPFRHTALGALIGFTVCTAVLVLHFVFHLPTSDLRARLYVFLFAFPLSVGASYFGALVLIASVALWLAGWRGWALVRAAALGGLAAMALLYSGLLSWTVWLHEDDVTPGGRLVRALAALGVALAAVVAARRSARVSPKAKTPHVATT